MASPQLSAIQMSAPQIDPRIESEAMSRRDTQASIGFKALQYRWHRAPTGFRTHFVVMCSRCSLTHLSPPSNVLSGSLIMMMSL
jgi:uncharacterized membrane protein YhiD involved in acid resistance